MYYCGYDRVKWSETDKGPAEWPDILRKTSAWQHLWSRPPLRLLTTYAGVKSSWASVLVLKVHDPEKGIGTQPQSLIESVSDDSASTTSPQPPSHQLNFLGQCLSDHPSIKRNSWVSMYWWAAQPETLCYQGEDHPFRDPTKENSLSQDHFCPRLWRNEATQFRAVPYIPTQWDGEPADHDPKCRMLLSSQETTTVLTPLDPAAYAYDLRGQTLKYKATIGRFFLLIFVKYY